MSDNRDKSLVMIQDIFQEYKNNPNRDEAYKQSILDKAYESRETSGVFGLWRVVFSSDKDMYTRLDNLSVKITAENSLKNYQKEPVPALLEQICSLAHAQSSNDRVWNEEKEKIWNEAFSCVSEFKSVFEEEKNYWKEWWAKLDKENQVYFDKINQPKPDPLDIVKISVPFIVREEYEVSQASPPPSLVNYMVNHFNDFELQSYMKIPHDLVQKSSMELINTNFIFTFECSKILNDEEKNLIVKELAGQLSDGWGSSLEQHQELIGHSEFSLSFDYQEIKLVSQSKKKKLN